MLNTKLDVEKMSIQLKCFCKRYFVIKQNVLGSRLQDWACAVPRSSINVGWVWQYPRWSGAHCAISLQPTLVSQRLHRPSVRPTSSWQGTITTYNSTAIVKKIFKTQKFWINNLEMSFLPKLSKKSVCITL